MQINTRDDKAVLCDAAMESASTLLKALEEIKNGECEGAVCLKYGINKHFIRRFIFKNNVFEQGLQGDSDCNEELAVSGGERLYKRIKPNTRVPYDVDKTVEFFLKESGLRNREVRVLRMMYWENMSLQDIGDVLGLTKERVRQIESLAIRRIRRKFYDVLKYGAAPFLKQRNDRLRTYIEETKKEIEKFNELYKESKKDESELLALKSTSEAAFGEGFEQGGLTVLEFIEECWERNEISVRLFNCFARGMQYKSFRWQPHTPIREMEKYTRKQIVSQVRSLGPKCADELEELLAKRGVHLRGSKK